jgi:hypothetical protein
MLSFAAAGTPPRGARFYRRWSSRAAEMALTASDPRMRTRCAHSATMWALIAHAIEAGDEDGFVQLTRNLACLGRLSARG